MDYWKIIEYMEGRLIHYVNFLEPKILVGLTLHHHSAPTDIKLHSSFFWRFYIKSVELSLCLHHVTSGNQLGDTIFLNECSNLRLIISKESSPSCPKAETT